MSQSLRSSTVLLSTGLPTMSMPRTAVQQTADCTGGFASVTYTEDCHKRLLLTFFEPFTEGAVCAPVTELVSAGPPDVDLQLDISGPGGPFSTTTTIDKFLS